MREDEISEQEARKASLSIEAAMKMLLALQKN
jgi:hypothetical protein